MKTTVSRFVSLLAVITGLSLITSDVAAAETCHRINAKAVGSITGATAAGFTTQSQITGGGLLHGTTTSDLNLLSFDPVTGVITFDGTLVLTAQQGTLTLFVFDGVYDTVSGEFSSPSIVVDGTGRFAGASGDIFFHGFVLEDGVTFVDDELSGEICTVK
jgi:hypothetical protein